MSSASPQPADPVNTSATAATILAMFCSMPERSISRFVLALLLVQMLCVGGAPRALADLDPASDVLLFDDVFVPRDPKVCSKLEQQLKKLVADARRAHYPVDVALIDTSADLGGVPQFLGQPQEYAQFLYGEIGTQIAGVVLIAMPGGFGMAPEQAEARVLEGRSIPEDANPDRLARETLQVIPKLAEAAGKTVEPPKIATSCSSKKGGGSSVLLFFAPIALLLMAGGAIALGRRGTRSSEA